MAKGRAHDRALARARAKRAAQRRQHRRRRGLIVGGTSLLALAVAATMVLALLPPRTQEPTIDTPTPSPQDLQSSPTSDGGVACGGTVPAGAGTEKPTFPAPPEMALAEGVDYRATLVTSCGEITVDLYEDRAPVTVNSFVFLARQGFYAGLTFHRVVPGFVIQGGDPQGTGSGGPGYQFEDELSVAQEQGYQPGSLAMANSGANTNGSQFFVVLPGGESRLTPDYSLFGDVVSGLDVAQRIAEVPLSGQQPMQTVYIEDVRIEEQPGGAATT